MVIIWTGIWIWFWTVRSTWHLVNVNPVLDKVCPSQSTTKSHVGFEECLISNGLANRLYNSAQPRPNAAQPPRTVAMTTLLFSACQKWSQEDCPCLTLSRPPFLQRKPHFLPVKRFLSAVLPNATKLCYKSVFLHFS